MRRTAWSRPKKTARNLLSAVLLLLLCWALSGFAPLTRGMLVRRVARENLLPEAEAVYQDQDGQGWQRLYLQSGDLFLRFSYTRNVLAYGNWEAFLFQGSQGAVCLPGGEEGVFLALGDLPDAERAELELSLSTDWERHWKIQGVRVSEHCFQFTAEQALEAEPELLELLPALMTPEAYYAYTLRLYDGGGDLLKTVTGPVWDGEEAR